MGEKETYPEIKFKLKLSKQESGSSGSGGEEISVGESVGGAGSIGENGAVEENSAVQNSEEGQGSEESTESQVSVEGNEGSSESGAGITGGVISDGENVVNGVVNAQEDFEYDSSGYDAEIISDSVSSESGGANAGDLKLNVKNDKLIVSTKYSEIEEGFGEEYIGKRKMTIPIDLGEFGIVAEESGTFSVEIVYNGNSIVKAQEDISVEAGNETVSNESTSEEPPIEEDESESGAGGGVVGNETIPSNETSIGNETGINQTVSNETSIGNETGINQTVSNETIPSNETISLNETQFNQTVVTSVFNASDNITVNTTQFNAVLGQPVKWVKKVELDINSSFKVTLQLPASAGNISIRKIEKNSEELARLVKSNESREKSIEDNPKEEVNST